MSKLDFSVCEKLSPHYDATWDLGDYDHGFQMWEGTVERRHLDNLLRASGWGQNRDLNTDGLV